MLQTILDCIKIKFQVHTKTSIPNFNEREIWCSGLILDKILVRGISSNSLLTEIF